MMPEGLHVPSLTWSQGVPSPPAIVIPPLGLNANGFLDVHIGQPSISECLNDSTVPGTKKHANHAGFEDTDFLATIQYPQIGNALGWRYEHRRSAQQILPFLYLGPSSAARDRAFLESEAITMVLAIRNTSGVQARLLGSDVAKDMGVEVGHVNIQSTMNLIEGFTTGINAINYHLNKVYKKLQTGVTHVTGKVLVFCETGNERSASLVVAYIMAMFEKDLVAAIQIVQTQRFSVNFDDSLRRLLSTYEAILTARRDVIGDAAMRQNASWQSPFLPTNHKRRLSNSSVNAMDECDDEVLSDRAIYVDQSARREGKAPFRDGC